MKLIISAMAFAVATAALAGPPAYAGKTDNVLRIAFRDPISGVDIIHDPKGETGLTGAAVYDTLLGYDVATRQFKPGLAQSWKQIDDTTYEFKLRGDVKFHDGTAFDADDVVTTISYIADPKSKFRLKTRFLFIKGAEKIDNRTVRIITKRIYAPAMMRIAISLPILPSEKFGALKRKSDWGKIAVGTGPYKVVSVGPSQGVVLERNKHYNIRKPATIDRVEIKPIPDVQTQMAQIMVGGIDLMTANSPDVVSALAANPDLKVSVTEGLLYFYISLDAKDRTGISVLKDMRVRQAIFHAIDRDAIRKNVVTGGEKSNRMDSLCFVSQVGCSGKGSQLAYDVAKAKALMKAAGQEGGFPLKITALPWSRGVAEAIGGYLSKIGIRASISTQTMGSYRRLQRTGKIQALVTQYSMGGLPDVGSLLSFYFGSKARDYYGDAELTKLAKQSDATLDPKARAKIMEQALARIAQRAYILPISGNPSVFVHHKDVTVDLTDKVAQLNPYGARLEMFGWAK